MRELTVEELEVVVGGGDEGGDPVIIIGLTD